MVSHNMFNALGIDSTLFGFFLGGGVIRYSIRKRIRFIVGNFKGDEYIIAMVLARIVALDSLFDSNMK